MTTDVVIVGAGVVGLACAAESSSKGFSTLVVERHGSFGQETSSHNSEVVHSGIYYTPGSLKAKLCVRANRNLYARCERDHVWIRKTGKLVVASSADEEPKLHEILLRGEANGVEGLRMLTGAEARKLEPNISCVAALLVPSAGIVDSHELMRSYIARSKDHTTHAADIVFHTSITGAEKTSGGFKLRLTESNGETTEVSTKYVINAAGISADRVASYFGIDPDASGYRVYPNRGHYYRVSPVKSKLVSRLIYPVPLPKLTGLGIHITLDRAGSVKLGPDAEYIDPSVPEVDWYRFDESRLTRFYEAALRYFPALELADITPDQVGVRSKIQKPGEEAQDFVIVEESARGLEGLVNLIGIESPGLTCSAEIAKLVVGKIVENG